MNDRRSFRWKCWHDGTLKDVVVNPLVDDQRNVEKGGVPGRLYERCGSSLKTVSGTIKQDSDGKVYFVSTGQGNEG